MGWVKVFASCKFLQEVYNDGCFQLQNAGKLFPVCASSNHSPTKFNSSWQLEEFLDKHTCQQTAVFVTHGRRHLLIGWHVHIRLGYPSSSHLLCKHLLHPVRRWNKRWHCIAKSLGRKVVCSICHLLAVGWGKVIKKGSNWTKIIIKWVW